MSDLLQSKKVIAILLLLGSFLVLLSFSTGKGDTEEKETAFDLTTYKENLESEVSALCAEVRGVGEVKVSLYFEMGEEYVYASDTTSSGGSDYVLSSGEGLLLSVRLPPVSGITVVCDGGNDPTIQRTLTALLTAHFGLGANRISVAAKK